MIGSNNTNSVKWKPFTVVDSSGDTQVSVVPKTTVINFNTTQNEYITDFHVYLARDISKEPWIDATINDDDYDCELYEVVFFVWVWALQAPWMSQVLNNLIAIKLHCVANN